MGSIRFSTSAAIPWKSVAFLLRGKFLKTRYSLENIQELRHQDAEVRTIMRISGIGVAKDHRGAFGIQGASRIPEISERLVAGSNRPLLNGIHGGQNARRDGDPQFKRVELVIAYEGADLGIGFIWDRKIGVVIILKFPAVSWDIGDRVPGREDIVPKCLHI